MIDNRQVARVPAWANPRRLNVKQAMGGMGTPPRYQLQGTAGMAQPPASPLPAWANYGPHGASFDAANMGYNPQAMDFMEVLRRTFGPRLQQSPGVRGPNNRPY